MAKKGWQGAMLKLYRGKDFTFTVVSSEQVTDHYLRVRLRGGGLLVEQEWYPTVWVRLWFDHPDNKIHQRAFTVIEADAESDEFTLEFALHDGISSRWAKAAQPGDEIEATLLATGSTSGKAETFALPEPLPAVALLAGDAASLPAVNSILGALGDVPAHVYLEWVHESDRDLPLHTRSIDQVTWVRRERDGEGMVEAVGKAFAGIGLPPEQFFCFAACDAKSTRSITKSFKEFGIPKDRMKTQGYWQP
ncbi:siderophore-interacting protein [Luteipulveratus mongoliensis]|uniref:FAD-binding FR-type domain-containing protein n=1 Tax=Luteipulveratus mongoliensis TaxID=571913 RepID=A0A0K1JEV0_9MICO|nr:siderophore-interacting protein [Luteipulveratus mongoliensis]AKU15224.1 hypothetical protein VV02_04015 [Luteipulveratus mongoliensis]